jgi:hypothetical protein
MLRRFLVFMCLMFLSFYVADVARGSLYCFYYSGGTMYDLNTVCSGIIPSGWTLNCATDINDSGWITGWATDMSGSKHGFLLAIPEPGTLVLLFTGLTALGLGWRRRTVRRGMVATAIYGLNPTEGSAFEACTMFGSKDVL